MADQKSPAYQRYPKDYLGDENVMLMTLEQEGAYNRLMDICWMEGSIPDDIRKLAALCKNISPKKMQAIWNVIGCCFVVHAELPDRLDHPRLIKEREKQERWRQKSSQGGKKSAAIRNGGSKVVADCLPPKSNIAVCSLPSASAVTDTSSSTRLRAYLGEHSAAVDRMSSSAEHGDTWADGLFALYGPQGTDTEVWKNPQTGQSVAAELRAGMLAVAIDRYAAEGKTYNGILFRRFLERARDERIGDGEGKRRHGNNRPGAGARADQPAKPGKYDHLEGADVRPGA